MKIKWLLLLILIAGFFLRTYRTQDLMGFYFDQGRDAKVIWNLWHQGKFFLIGPTTGIEGIFLGPFYYYLISPAYLLGGGNPVFPAVQLAVINILGILVIYKLGVEFFSPSAGLISAFLLSFSNRLAQDHRWLSNPTPLPLFSALSVYFLIKIINHKDKAIHYPLLGLCLGLSLQLEAASAVFFLPATIIVLLLMRRPLIFKYIHLLHLFVAFLITLIPQLWFNFRHGNILFQAFHRFLVSEKSFQTVLPSFYSDRLKFYYQVFMEKLINDNHLLPIFIILIIIAVYFGYKQIINKNTGLLVVWIATPLALLLFYHGNYGYVWGYYFTGIYPIFILLLSVLLATAYHRHNLGKSAVIILLSLFLFDNLHHLKNFLTAGLEGPYSITLGNSLAAVDWVYQDAGSTPFNVDVYVPPVISHSYDYLFLWRGQTKFHNQPTDHLVPRLYTLLEQDPPHPERLEAWLTRQAGYAYIDTQVSFGGVSAQRRTRYP